MEFPSLFVREQEIAGRRCAAVHADVDAHRHVIGREVDLLDDRWRCDIAPVTGILRIRGLDAKPVAPVGGRIFRRDGIQGVARENKIVIPEIGRVRNSGIGHTGLVFHPDLNATEVRIESIVAGPDRAERAHPDGGDIADGNVGINRQDAFRRLIQFRRVRIDAGRRAQEQGP